MVRFSPQVRNKGLKLEGSLDARTGPSGRAPLNFFPSLRNVWTSATMAGVAVCDRYLC